MSINKLTCDGQFELHGSFYPNNLAWIQLPWMQKDVNGILGKFALEYWECMKRYTMGTGGGPGAPENIPLGKPRTRATFHDTTTSVQSMSRGGPTSGTSSLVFPLFQKRKDPMPDDCIIDDIVHFGDKEVNEENDPGEMQGLTTPLPTGQEIMRPGQHPVPNWNLHKRWVRDVRRSRKQQRKF